MTIDLRPALTVVKSHKQDLNFVTATEKDNYEIALEEYFEALSTRTTEDFRAAVQMAVDGAKTLITIAVATFGVFALVIQYGFSHKLGWISTGALAVAECCLIISMMFGLNVLGMAFKRAEGLENPTLPPWSTKPLGPSLMRQSYLGLASLLAFAVGIGFWNTPAETRNQPAMTKAEFQHLQENVEKQGNILAELRAILPLNQIIQEVSEKQNRIIIRIDSVRKQIENQSDQIENLR